MGKGLGKSSSNKIICKKGKKWAKVRAARIQVIFKPCEYNWYCDICILLIMTLTVCTLTHITACVCLFSGPENNYGYAFNTGYGQQPTATNDVSIVLIKNVKSFKH